ncbi:hypothetical protein ACWNT8_06465 [Pigmentibacter ruber]|nr:hypothetical protein GTC16762_27150 [Pigmentibacter ruber]
MSFDLQKNSVAVHSSRLTPEFKKVFYAESGKTHLKQVKVLPQMSKEECTETQVVKFNDDSQLISDSKIYALKKRLLAPAWWVEGLLLSLGTKEAWFDSLVAKRLGKVVTAPSKINAKNIVLLFGIWHEALSKIFSLKKDDLTLKFQINKYLSGTQKDVLEACKQLEEIWVTPYNLFEVKHAKKNKQISLAKSGSFSFIRHAQVENDVDGIWLSMTLSQPIQTLYLMEKANFNSNSLKASFISINPVVIQSMGRKASIKKILNYLFLEYSKQEGIEFNISNWGSIPIDTKNISSFHKEILASVPSLYDHGVLGWNIAPPNIKLSELKNKMLDNSSNSSESKASSIVYCWQMSEQAKEAFELEQAISEKLMSLTHEENLHAAKTINSLYKARKSETLFPEPPPDQLTKIRKEKALKQEKLDKLERKIELKKETVVKKTVNKRIPVETLFDSSEYKKNVDVEIIENKKNDLEKIEKVTKKKEIVKKKEMSIKETLSDDDFIVLVSEFYESLKPLQKKAFERERAGMNPEQFRLYMTPILKRKSNKILK